MRSKKVVGPVGDMIKATMGVAEAEILASAIENDPSATVQAIKANLRAAVTGPVEVPKTRAPKS